MYKLHQKYLLLCVAQHRSGSSRNFIPRLAQWSVPPLEKHPPAVYEAGITGLLGVFIICLSCMNHSCQKGQLGSQQCEFQKQIAQ